MCGIAGVLHFDGTAAGAQLVRRMIGMVRHRGPDAAGAYLDGPVGLGHARLSILDLEGGGQPMYTEDGSLAITFNGEIFNYLELREELLAHGRRFVTRSDTEVILHAYEVYGDRCVERFNGQWALALWDRRRRRLFVSRDRLGVRPLFYTIVGGRLLFASEIKCLFADPAVPRAIDPRGLQQAFTFWTAVAPTTTFQGVRELPPGHNLVVEDGRIDVRRHWRLSYAPEPMDPARCAGELLELLTDATRLRLRSDVPVGCCLSGGLDSSITTALAQQAAGGRLKTFSVAFDEPEFDESRFQAEVVAALRTDHHAVLCTHEAIGRAFPEVVWHAERPVLRTAPAPLFLLSRLIRDRGCKVVVTGEGADEMLGGYDLFKEAKVRRFWARDLASARRAALLANLYPYLPGVQAQPLSYRKAFFHVRPEDLASPWFSHAPRWDLTSRLTRFFTRELQAELAGYDPCLDCLALLPDDYSRWPAFCQAQYLETTVLLPGYILASQGDRMAMAHGVEGRFPFLDYRVAEFAARIPPRLKMQGLNEKHLLKRAAGHLVPRSIVERPKQPYRAPDAKSFFGDPERPLRHEYVEEILSPECVRSAGLFQPEMVAGLVRKAAAGRLSSAKDNMALVGILSAQLLAAHFVRDLDSPPVANSVVAVACPSAPA